MYLLNRTFLLQIQIYWKLEVTIQIPANELSKKSQGLSDSRSAYTL